MENEKRFLLTKAHFAKIAGLLLRELDKLIEDGKVETIKTSNRMVFIPFEELEKLVKNDGK